MKVFPTRKYKKHEVVPKLTRVEQMTKKVALALAFISVFSFFFKILFF